MPFIQKEDYDFLIKNFQNQVLINENCIVQPVFEEKKGNPIVFSASYRAAILVHQDPEGCRSIVQKNKVFLHQVAMPSDAILKDIDDWETYSTAMAHQKSR
jgi:molybdenum cofactor cytidylyltransferase